MLNFKAFGVFAALGTAVIFTHEEKKLEAKRCFEYLEEFRGLARLAEPHLTGSGIITHDLTTIVGRYKLTSDSLSSRTCRSALEFLPVDSVEMKRALREARRLDLILKNLETAP